MSVSNVICKAIVKKLIVDVTYCLGDKSLGDYVIEEQFPQTLLLTPVDEWRQKIWIPNPQALESHNIVTIKDQNYFRIELYEPIDPNKSHRQLVWKLKFKLEDLR